jgi:hypothetical protein
MVLLVTAGSQEPTELPGIPASVGSVVTQALVVPTELQAIVDSAALTELVATRASPERRGLQVIQASVEPAVTLASQVLAEPLGIVVLVARMGHPVTVGSAGYQVTADSLV